MRAAEPKPEHLTPAQIGEPMRIAVYDGLVSGIEQVLQHRAKAEPHGDMDMYADAVAPLAVGAVYGLIQIMWQFMPEGSTEEDIANALSRACAVGINGAQKMEPAGGFYRSGTTRASVQ